MNSYLLIRIFMQHGRETPLIHQRNKTDTTTYDQRTKFTLLKLPKPSTTNTTAEKFYNNFFY